MKHVNQVDTLNSVKAFKTVLVFRNQQLMDLRVNNVRGQISDGMWENSKNTRWLYIDTTYILGNKTEVIVDSEYRVGRKKLPAY